jgi:hypothetical protein
MDDSIQLIFYPPTQVISVYENPGCTAKQFTGYLKLYNYCTPAKRAKALEGCYSFLSPTMNGGANQRGKLPSPKKTAEGE